MATASTQFLWRRLDAAGHDACRLVASATGYRLQGMAVFREGRQACQLRYAVIADTSFRARRAEVEGYLGHREVALSIRKGRDAEWLVNGAACPLLSGCLDIDLGFTPATNLFAIRRLALRVGERAKVPALYVAFPSLRLRVLPQAYHRVSPRAYGYESPSHGYRGTLMVSRAGAIESYPGLFELERLR